MTGKKEPAVEQHVAFRMSTTNEGLVGEAGTGLPDGFTIRMVVGSTMLTCKLRMTPALGHTKLETISGKTDGNDNAVVEPGTVCVEPGTTCTTLPNMTNASTGTPGKLPRMIPVDSGAIVDVVDVVPLVKGMLGIVTGVVNATVLPVREMKTAGMLPEAYGIMAPVVAGDNGWGIEHAGDDVETLYALVCFCALCVTVENGSSVPNVLDFF